MDDADKPRYTVRVVAERLGVPTATLRSWSQRYGVGPSHHRPGRHRLYSDNDIAAVQHMQDLIGQGTSPRSAARLAIEAFTPARGDVDSVLSASLDLDLASLSRLLDTHLSHFGVLATWELIVRPVFEAVVTKQVVDGGCIDVEHALSWAVSRSLHRTPPVALDASAAIILACTPGETHVLPLEALRAALAERGRGALILGATVPVAALTDAIGRVPSPVRVVLWSQTADTADMDMVRTVATGSEVLLGGPGWDDRAAGPATRVYSLSEAVERCTSAL